MEVRFRQVSDPEADDIVIVIERTGDGWKIRLPDGTDRTVDSARLPNDVLMVHDGNRTVRVPFAVSKRGIEMSFGGAAYAFKQVKSEAGLMKSSTTASGIATGELTAPMSGVIAEILVQPAQHVDAYQPVVVVEAMKVYASVDAPFSGTVANVAVAKGQQVEHGVVLAVIVPVEQEGGRS